jgi:intracellular septation protein A
VSGFGPVLAFYAGYKVQGLVLGIILATLTGVALYAYEHAHGRPGFIARFVLAIIVVQAAVGLISRNATLYFFQPVAVDTVIALGFIGSVVVRRPVIGEFARESYPFPPEVRESQTFKNIYGRITLIWGTYYALRALVRLVGLASGRIEILLAILAISGTPIIIALTLFTFWYSVRSFRRSAEWGGAIAELEKA